MSVNFWEEADVIHAYTRQEALADGVLIDISKIAREAGHPYPAAITIALHERLTPNNFEKSWGQSFEGRLWDAMRLAFLACVREARKPKNQQDDRLFFKMLIQEQKGKQMVMNTITIKFSIAPDETGQPCITMGLA